MDRDSRSPWQVCRYHKCGLVQTGYEQYAVQAVPPSGKTLVFRHEGTTLNVARNLRIVERRGDCGISDADGADAVFDVKDSE